jgi:hypothetical protein
MVEIEWSAEGRMYKKQAALVLVLVFVLVLCLCCFYFLFLSFDIDIKITAPFATLRLRDWRRRLLCVCV